MVLCEHENNSFLKIVFFLDLTQEYIILDYSKLELDRFLAFARPQPARLVPCVGGAPADPGPADARAAEPHGGARDALCHPQSPCPACRAASAAHVAQLRPSFSFESAAVRLVS